MAENLSDGEKKWVTEEVRKGNGTQAGLTEVARHCSAALAKHDENVRDLKKSWQR